MGFFPAQALRGGWCCWWAVLQKKGRTAEAGTPCCRLGAPGPALTLQPVAPASPVPRAAVCDLLWRGGEDPGCRGERVCVWWKGLGARPVWALLQPQVVPNMSSAPAHPARALLFRPLLGQTAPPTGLPCLRPRVLCVHCSVSLQWFCVGHLPVSCEKSRIQQGFVLEIATSLSDLCC